MLLRDPVHGLIRFEGQREALIGALLGTREVQRLRRVRQLGLTSLVFPGAEHSRFAHAIGAAHVMARLLSRVAQVAPILPWEHRPDEAMEHDALAAALLHDLGHGPFSHLFEEVTPSSRTHEDWTQEALLTPTTEVHQVLRALDPGMPERVAGLLSGKHPAVWLKRSVSGTLDVDRSDYLLRDSHMTGVAYGHFDLDWLLQALTFAELPSGEWVLAIEGRKGLPPIESFFLARQFMYQQVYHHKATRAAERLIESIFVRVAERIKEGAPSMMVPSALRAAVMGEPLEWSSYFELDDSMLTHCLAHWERDTDPILARMSADLLHRRLPKTLPLPEESEVEGDDPRALWEEALERAKEVAKERGLVPERAVWLDLAEEVPYLEPDDPSSSEGLWVSLSHRPMLRLGQASFLLRQLRNQRIVRPRLIFLAELREEVEAAVGELLADAA